MWIGECGGQAERRLCGHGQHSRTDVELAVESGWRQQTHNCCWRSTNVSYPCIIVNFCNAISCFIITYLYVFLVIVVSDWVFLTFPFISPAINYQLHWATTSCGGGLRWNQKLQFVISQDNLAEVLNIHVAVQIIGVYHHCLIGGFNISAINIITLDWHESGSKTIFIFRALSKFRTDQMSLKMLPECFRRDLKLPSEMVKTPADAARKPEDVLDYIPGNLYCNNALPNPHLTATISTQTPPFP